MHAPKDGDGDGTIGNRPPGYWNRVAQEQERRRIEDTVKEEHAKARAAARADGPGQGVGWADLGKASVTRNLPSEEEDFRRGMAEGLGVNYSLAEVVGMEHVNVDAVTYRLRTAEVAVTGLQRVQAESLYGLGLATGRELRRRAEGDTTIRSEASKEDIGCVAGVPSKKDMEPPGLEAAHVANPIEGDATRLLRYMQRLINEELALYEMPIDAVDVPRVLSWAGGGSLGGAYSEVHLGIEGVGVVYVPKEVAVRGIENMRASVQQAVREAVEHAVAHERSRDMPSLELASVILHELAGEVSLCWSPKPEGTFVSSKAMQAVERALKRLASPRPTCTPVDGPLDGPCQASAA